MVLAFAELQSPLIPTHFELRLCIRSPFALCQTAHDRLLHSRNHLNAIASAVSFQKQSPFGLEQTNDQDAALFHQHALVTMQNSTLANLNMRDCRLVGMNDSKARMLGAEERSTASAEKSHKSRACALACVHLRVPARALAHAGNNPLARHHMHIGARDKEVFTRPERWRTTSGRNPLISSRR